MFNYPVYSNIYAIRTKKPNGFWTLERCLEEARKYQNKKDWRAFSRASFDAAWRYQWLELCTRHMIKQTNFFDEFLWQHNTQCVLPTKVKKLPRILNSWPFEKCLNDALQYRSKKEWRTFSPKCYLIARQKKWLELCCAKMKKPRKWTLEACQASARQYKSRVEWSRNALGAYRAALKNRWFDLCCKSLTPLKKPTGYWTLERCQQDALQYQFRTEWKKKSRGAYEAAYINQWLNLCCSHMMPKPRERKESKP